MRDRFRGGVGGAGGSGTVCGSIEQDPVDGVWRFSGIVTGQGNIDLTTPGADVTATLMHTEVVWSNGALNVIRRPVEAVAEGRVFGIAEGIYKLGQAFRLAR